MSAHFDLWNIQTIMQTKHIVEYMQNLVWNIQVCGNSLMESGQYKKGAIDTSKYTYEEIILHRNKTTILLLMRRY
ncbi:hypothetical protein MXB_4072 [Myxobolus squamalis]|nr:hypothetical protein MXB_4072 [Myxobolus squamalis]